MQNSEADIDWLERAWNGYRERHPVKFCVICGQEWLASDLDKRGRCPSCRSWRTRVLIACDWLGRSWRAMIGVGV
jgi:hypothetical protein